MSVIYHIHRNSPLKMHAVNCAPYFRRIRSDLLGKSAESPAGELLEVSMLGNLRPRRAVKSVPVPLNAEEMVKHLMIADPKQHDDLYIFDHQFFNNIFPLPPTSNLFILL